MNKELEENLSYLASLQAEFTNKRNEISKKVCQGVNLDIIRTKFIKLCYDHTGIPTDFVLSKYECIVDYKALKLVCKTRNFANSYSFEVFLDYKELDNWENALVSKFPTLETKILVELNRLNMTSINLYDTRGGTNVTGYLGSVTECFYSFFKNFKEVKWTCLPLSDKQVKIQMWIK